MNRQETYHVRIREEVIALAKKLARECWPGGSDGVVAEVAADAVHEAAVQLDAAAIKSRFGR